MSVFKIVERSTLSFAWKRDGTVYNIHWIVDTWVITALPNYEEPKTKYAYRSNGYHSNFVPLNFIIQEQITNLCQTKVVDMVSGKIRNTNGISLLLMSFLHTICTTLLSSLLKSFWFRKHFNQIFKDFPPTIPIHWNRDKQTPSSKFTINGLYTGRDLTS